MKQRVIYQNNPLTEVICQFRYPPILRIDTEKPAEFQEKIRKEFPNFQENRNINLQIPEEIASFLSVDIGKLRDVKPGYEFATQDNNWAISLTRDFIALTSRDYKQWEDFREKIEKPIRALDEIYSPSYFSRIGLRYQNVIQRSELGLDDVPWAELIKPTLAGFLSSQQQKLAVEETRHVTLLNLDDDLGKVRIRYGTVLHEPTGEVCFLIDNDFFAGGENDIENGLKIIQAFNRQNRNLFDWCITRKLHAAMGPDKL